MANSSIPVGLVCFVKASITGSRFSLPVEPLIMALQWWIPMIMASFRKTRKAVDTHAAWKRRLKKFCDLPEKHLFWSVKFFEVGCIPTKHVLSL
jgi:hypothetical protein